MKHTHDIEKINRHNFRGSLEALSRPGESQNILPLFDSGLLAMASVLLYAEVTYCYQGKLDFQLIKAVCGAHSASASEADYLFFDHPDVDFLHHAKPGSADNPELGATLIFSYESSQADFTNVNLEGPGINGKRLVKLPVNELFIDCLLEKNYSFPMGVDLFFLSEHNELLGLPRTTRIEVAS